VERPGASQERTRHARRAINAATHQSNKHKGEQCMVWIASDPSVVGSSETDVAIGDGT
jgi:hypothetical protein